MSKYLHISNKMLDEIIRQGRDYNEHSHPPEVIAEICRRFKKMRMMDALMRERRWMYLNKEIGQPTPKLKYLKPSGRANDRFDRELNSHLEPKKGVK